VGKGQEACPSRVREVRWGSGAGVVPDGRLFSQLIGWLIGWSACGGGPLCLKLTNMERAFVRYCICDGAATVVCNLIGMYGRAAPLVAGDARGGCVRGEAATHSILSDTETGAGEPKCKEGLPCALA
jgi:hypothetical protein